MGANKANLQRSRGQESIEIMWRLLKISLSYCIKYMKG
jgi:hypothetical protein